MQPVWKAVFALAALNYMYILYLTNTKFRYFFAHPKENKYVGFHLNKGRMGNQLFHLITGYGIARTLNRVHFLPYDPKLLPRAKRHLRELRDVFPLLEKTYVVGKSDTKETFVPFVGEGCCWYEDPRRYLNSTAKYLHLDLQYGANPRYFLEYLDDIRVLLQFSSQVRKQGNYIIDSMALSRSNTMCLHTRRTDFIARNGASNLKQTVKAANRIANRLQLNRFLIFGDDQSFMRKVSREIVKTGKWERDAVAVSNFEEGIDFYLSSQICRSFLMTAVTSTFGWWLAFFSIDQNAVFYVTDHRKQGMKIPSKDLFLKTWQQV